jgi:bacteriorhodopsin
MLTGLQHSHAAMRWIVIIIAIIALVRLAMIFMQNKDQFTKGDNTILRLFVILFDTQVLIGIIFLITWAMGKIPLQSYHWEHLATMLIATALVHVTAKWKQSPAKLRAKNTLIFILIALIVVALGITRLPQGWQLMPV